MRSGCRLEVGEYSAYGRMAARTNGPNDSIEVCEPLQFNPDHFSEPICPKVVERRRITDNDQPFNAVDKLAGDITGQRRSVEFTSRDTVDLSGLVGPGALIPTRVRTDKG